MRACRGSWGGGVCDQAGAQAEASFLPGQGKPVGTRRGVPGCCSCQGCGETSQGRKGSGPAHHDCAVPHPGPETRGSGLRGKRPQPKVSCDRRAQGDPEAAALELWGIGAGSGTFAGGNNTAIILPILNVKSIPFSALFSLLGPCPRWCACLETTELSGLQNKMGRRPWL